MTEFVSTLNPSSGSPQYSAAEYDSYPAERMLRTETCPRRPDSVTVRPLHVSRIQQVL